MNTFTTSYQGTASLGTAAHVQLLDPSDGTTVIVDRTNTGITETDPGFYVYTAQVATTLRVLQAAWDENDGVLRRELVTTTSTTTSPPGSGAERYVTFDELKASLSLTGQSYADADILIALAAASRGLEDAYETYWIAPTADARYYTRSGVREVHLGDVLSLTEVALDYSYSDLDMDGRVWDWDTGLGTYSTILDPAWFRLLPIQNGPSGNGEPFQTLQLTRASQRLILPSGQDAIRITGTFGWTTIPSGVKVAVTMIASRLLRRTREAPFGILAVGAEGAAIRARDIANDPDIRFVMGPAAGTTSLFV